MDEKKGETKAKERMKKEKLKLKNEKDLFFLYMSWNYVSRVQVV